MIIWHVSCYDGPITFYLCEDSSFCWNDLNDIIDVAFYVQINPDALYGILNKSNQDKILFMPFSVHLHADQSQKHILFF